MTKLQKKRPKRRPLLLWLKVRNGIRSLKYELEPVAIFILALPVLLVMEIIEKCRRYCPVHKERFQYEILNISEEKAKINRERERTKIRTTVRLKPEHMERRRKEFPYANSEYPSFVTAGIHRVRYCSSCRKAEGKYFKVEDTCSNVRSLTELSEEERIILECELEQLERKLGLVPHKQAVESEGATRNQEADTGDLRQA